ncbi:hypothetical protein [Sorangium atrum]|uniref:Uncharacterized protein n=1 Tax=Sorangium atrum TaxID=2995308 RepID=A0ABT5BU25_9BACT|nr:hypothetical protein [Sorangium aterium]MDC0677655.1 hypothetical protein [Sorangium aterium]
MLRNAKINTPRIARLTVATVVVAAAPVCFTLAAPARAAVIDVQCVGSFDRSFSPAVTVTSQTVTVTEAFDYDTCVLGPSATGAASITLSLGCVPVSAGPPETETVTWNDATGGTSTITWSAPSVVGQTAIFTGTVTAGRYAGDSATKVTSGISYLGSVVGCLLGTPVSNTTGLVDSIVLTQ